MIFVSNMEKNKTSKKAKGRQKFEGNEVKYCGFRDFLKK